MNRKKKRDKKKAQQARIRRNNTPKGSWIPRLGTVMLSVDQEKHAREQEEIRIKALEEMIEVLEKKEKETKLLGEYKELLQNCK